MGRDGSRLCCVSFRIVDGAGWPVLRCQLWILIVSGDTSCESSVPGLLARQRVSRMFWVWFGMVIGSGVWCLGVGSGVVARVVV